MSKMMNSHFITVLLLTVFISMITPSVSAQDDVLESTLLEPPDPNGITEVAVGIFVTQITGYNEQDENFEIEAVLQLTWSDVRQAFDPELFGSDTKFFVEVEVESLQKRGLIWIPEIAITTQQGSKFIEHHAIEIFADGTVKYIERFHATIQDPDIDFHQFPLDTQTLEIPLESLIYPANTVLLNIDNDFTGLGNALGIESWIIDEFSIQQTLVMEEWSNDTFSRITYTMPATRRIEYYVFTFIAPLVILLLIAYATFFIHDHDMRIDAAMGTMLLLIAFQFTLKGNLPQLAYLTFFDALLFVNFLLTAGAVFINIYTKWLSTHERTEHGKQISKLLVRGFPFTYIASIFGLVVYYF